MNLIEVLIVVGIIAVVMALAASGIVRFRATAGRVACAHNLGEIARASGQYTLKTKHFLPAAYNWEPYDDRVGWADAPLPDYDPSKTLLWPYLQTGEVFKCPEGFNLVPDTPNYGGPLQIGYAISGITGGPAGMRPNEVTRGQANVLLIWEHGFVPTCGCIVGNQTVPCQPFADPPNGGHYPTARHLNVMNALYCDGHVEQVFFAEMALERFYAK
jgi:prepilin-type processing-associated H-X9-DG protein